MSISTTSSSARITTQNGDNTLTREGAKLAKRELRRQKMTALALVAPLLFFIVFAFVAPIGTMLNRGFHNPAVAELIPKTLDALKQWDGKEVPNPKTIRIFAAELKVLANQRRSGKLAEEINRNKPGASSAIKSSARKLSKIEDSVLTEAGENTLFSLHKIWNTPEIWHAIKRAGKVYTDAYFLTALDLERNTDGDIQTRASSQIYIELYTKTLRLAMIITVLCIVLGYPLAYYLANAPTKRANLLMILVLLPFWTSLLVRTTAWIALLQTNGVVNSFLMSIYVIKEPLELLYTEFSTIVAMTHILLPFMILPLYSVMKGIDPSYMRAAMSMGARPVRAFIGVYLPNTLPGLSAGALLVFIISVGYYITPALVGGTDGQMISNIIAFHMQQSNNWGLAAALGSLLLVLILILYWTYDRFVGASNIKLG